MHHGEDAAGRCLRGNVEINDITGAIVEASISIHRGLGPGVFESVYESVLASKLTRRGLHVERQHPVSFTYDEMHPERGAPRSYLAPASRRRSSGNQFGTTTSWKSFRFVTRPRNRPSRAIS